MIVCVAHLLSFFVVLLALLINFYFLIRGRSEYSTISSTLRTQESGSGATLEEQLSDLIEGSLSFYQRQINELEQQLKDLKRNLNYYKSQHNYHSDGDTANYVNYADEKLGATIRAVRAEPVVKRTSVMDWAQTSNPPVNIIRANMEPGCCYAFKNCKAEIEIKLAKEVHIEYIKIEHIPKSLSPTKDTSSAPRNFSVYGVDSRTGDQAHLGDFEFNNQAPAQVFVLPIKRVLRIIRIQFKTNHGNPKYTCVYRVLVYGEPS